MSNHTKGHDHKLDIVCLQCVINKYEQYDKLLAFVKEIRELDWYHCECKVYISHDARELLKEIGEIE